MKVKLSVLSAVCALLFSIGFANSVTAQVAHPAPVHVTIESNAADEINIEATVFRPASASDEFPVPMILHSHGWGGSRSRTGFANWLNAGFGILSFDQRGFGESGGQANVQDPELEALDVDAVIDYVATLPWVALDAPGDPKLGAIGGSYGGGYQTMSSLTEAHAYGATRFNALAPEISWYDLPDSLGPEGTVRTLWTTALYAAGYQALPEFVHEGFREGLVTGAFPDSLRAEFYAHSPASFIDQNTRLDIPVLIRQGASDNLFNLNQGIRLADNITTGDSFLVGYNGGHVLPEALPLSNTASGDKCSPAVGGFEALTIDFYTRVFNGNSLNGLLPAKYNFTTSDGASCISRDNISPNTEINLDLPIVSVAALAGPVQQIKIADGPITIAGIARLEADITALGLDARAFLGLSSGATPLTATLLHNNVLPVRVVNGDTDGRRFWDLAGVAAAVPLGESLYLTVSSTASAFVGYSSRTPGILLFENVVLHLPDGYAPLPF